MTPQELAAAERKTPPKPAARPFGNAPAADPCDALHGNPSLPLPAAHSGGRLEILPSGCDQPLWRSHGQPPGAAFVTVNVWDGAFLGHAAESALLEDGDYHVRWLDDQGAPRAMSQLKVRAWPVFAADLASLACPRDLEPLGWQVRGAWTCSPKGLRPASGPAQLFHAGAMHGRIEAAFHLAAPPPDGAAWGLIARHYNHANHLRLFLRQEGACWRAGLARHPGAAGGPDHVVLAHTLLEAPPAAGARLAWALNGATHRVYLNGVLILEASDGYMGGVEIAGLYAGSDAVAWSAFRMATTQRVPVVRVQFPAYAASIRPGNVASLRLLQSPAPHQDLCWESGVQFGHIGGSEIKFTQGARLATLENGPVLTSVAWSGPMPKFVEQSHDVRGWARGAARFYDDAIIVDDRVLAWVRRSVGPDLDLLSSLVDGPARVCPAGQDQFTEWQPPPCGQTLSPVLAGSPPRFPVALAVPLRLAGERWWLTLLCLLRRPAPSTARLFAWHCAHGLTASYDLRVSPTQPGLEYAYTHVVRWQRAETPACVERGLLDLRQAWLQPMRLDVLAGERVAFDDRGEQPREALDFNGSFDMSSGQYAGRASDGRFAVRLDPLDIPRPAPVFAIRAWPHAAAPHIRLDGRPLAPGLDYASQITSTGELLIRLKHTIARPAQFEASDR